MSLFSVTVPTWLRDEMRAQAAQLKRIADVLEAAAEPDNPDDLAAQIDALTAKLKASQEGLTGAIDSVPKP
jgi:ABC-type Zn uptake system ZnuABC Zn-binding protein ZnuA